MTSTGEAGGQIGGSGSPDAGINPRALDPGGRRLESPARRGERVYAVNQSRGEGRVAPVEPVVTILVHSTGATSIRSSLLPLFGRDGHLPKLGRPAPRGERPCSIVLPVRVYRLHLHLALRQKNCTLGIAG